MSKKKKMMIFGGSALALVAASLILVTAGIPSGAASSAHLRGTDAYYANSEPATAEAVGGQLLTNLSDNTIAKIQFNAEYRIGLEWADESPEAAATAFTKSTAKVRSALIVMMGSKTSKDLRGSNLLVFKEEVVQMLNRVVFPESMARVDDIVFETLLVQS